MPQLLLSVGLLLPLALDTFALAAALGVAGLESRDRIRVTVVFTAFETLMPVIGIVVGRAAGQVLGDWAEYGGIAFLVVAGVLLIWPSKDDTAETRRLSLLTHAHGWAVLGLGMSISIDELTIGLSAGLIRLSIVTTIVWIAIQAFAATQVGLRLGSRLGEVARERAEWAAGAMLIVVALILLGLRLHPIQGG